MSPVNSFNYIPPKNCAMDMYNMTNKMEIKHTNYMNIGVILLT